MLGTHPTRYLYFISPNRWGLFSFDLFDSVLNYHQRVVNTCQNIYGEMLSCPFYNEFKIVLFDATSERAITSNDRIRTNGATDVYELQSLNWRLLGRYTLPVFLGTGVSSPRLPAPVRPCLPWPSCSLSVVTEVPVSAQPPSSLRGHGPPHPRNFLDYKVRPVHPTLPYNFSKFYPSLVGPDSSCTYGCTGHLSSPESDLRQRW